MSFFENISPSIKKTLVLHGERSICWINFAKKKNRVFQWLFRDIFTTSVYELTWCLEDVSVTMDYSYNFFYYYSFVLFQTHTRRIYEKIDQRVWLNNGFVMTYVVFGLVAMQKVNTSFSLSLLWNINVVFSVSLSLYFESSLFFHWSGHSQHINI